MEMNLIFKTMSLENKKYNFHSIMHPIRNRNYYLE